MLARDTSETLRGETHGNSVRNSILPTYFLGYGTKPFREDSFLRYNQARTRAQGGARAPLPRQQLFFASLFLPPSFFRVLFSSSSPSAPLLSFRFPHFPPSPSLNARREIRDMHCFLQEKQWGRFCANDEARPPRLVSGGSLLKAKQTFSQSQPLWRSNNRSPPPSLLLLPGKTGAQLENSFIR